MTIIEGFEAYSLNSWLDRGMSVQIEKSKTATEPKKKKPNRAQGLLARIATTSALVMGAAISNFAWAGSTEVPYSSVRTPEQLAETGSSRDDLTVSSGKYVNDLMKRLASAPTLPNDDLSIADPDSFF